MDACIPYEWERKPAKSNSTKRWSRKFKAGGRNMGCKWIKRGDQEETKKMAIVIVRMLDEREEALKIIKEQIER
jgi:hypothetical protein